MKRVLIVSIAALALAGCSREGPSDENSVNIVADNAYENVMPDESAIPVQNTLNVTNTAEAAVPPPSIDEQQQTQDDADATGMTARVDREAATENSAEAVPVDRD